MSATMEDFEDLFQNAPFAYLVLGGDERIALANAALADWTGYPADDLVGKRLRELMSVGTSMFYETSLAPLLMVHGTFEEASLDLRTADGRKIAVFASAKRVRDASGLRASTRMAFHKSVDRRRYERQLVEDRARSEEAERATLSALRSERETAELREQFIAVLGHDLRNPLGSISAGAKLLQKEQPPERRQRLFDAILGSVVRMSGLIDNLMDFARGRLGAGIPLEWQPVMLGPVLEQVVTELRIGQPDRVIDTDIALPCPIGCDPSRIGQLLSNLVGNALTHGSATEPVRVHAGVDATTLTIWVGNGGRPIPEATLARLFQPFFRGNAEPSRQGLGLGLHIASEIAKAHGGTLVATSAPEETRFTFAMAITRGA